MSNDLKFNIGADRVDFIASLVNATTKQYLLSRMKQREKDLHRYHSFLDALYLELRTYVDDDDARESVESPLDDAAELMEHHGYSHDGTRTAKDYTDIMDHLRDAHTALAQIRRDINLDIPEAQQWNPDTAGKDGLIDT